MKKQSKLITANEMYKAAFLLKKTRFAQEHPELSEADIQKKTISYFQNLKERKK